MFAYFLWVKKIFLSFSLWSILGTERFNGSLTSVFLIMSIDVHVSSSLQELLFVEVMKMLNWFNRVICCNKYLKRKIKSWVRICFNFHFRNQFDEFATTSRIFLTSKAKTKFRFFPACDSFNSKENVPRHSKSFFIQSTTLKIRMNRRSSQARKRQIIWKTSEK